MPAISPGDVIDCCLLQISKTFKDQQVLKDISWDVKRGERVGLVGGHTHHAIFLS